jgi:hypothetical protein
MSESNGGNNGKNGGKNRDDPVEDDQNDLNRIDIVSDDGQQAGNGGRVPEDPAQNQGVNAAGNNPPPRRPKTPDDVHQPVETNVIVHNKGHHPAASRDPVPPAKKGPEESTSLRKTSNSWPSLGWISAMKP